jgi:hypothetical protein
METEEGYWLAEESLNYYRCPYDYYCEGGAEVGNQQCADFREGPLCAQCEEGYTQNFDGECEACAADGASWTVIILVLLGAAFALWLQFFLLLRAAAPLIAASIIEDQRIERSKEGFTDDMAEFDDFDADLRYEGVITIDGAPAVKPDFTYKLKIVVSFIQIMTNLSVGLDIQWPSRFTSFVEAFNFFNLDLMRLAGTDCVADTNYWYNLYFWSFFPPCLLVFVYLVYLLPINLRNRGGANGSVEVSMRASQDQKRNRKIGRRNFWRLTLFSLFLVYPSISSTILRTFVCDEVEGTFYLRADFSVTCFDSGWYPNAAFAACMTLLYPIGIPAFFFYLLYKYRNPVDRLEEKGIRAQLGFLYDGYERSSWYFELLDMLHKLTLTSLIAFIPWEYQMTGAMIVVCLFIGTIQIVNPYLRKADNRLHLVSLVEVLLMLFAGNVFNSQDEPDDLMDWLLSIVLIGIVVCFFAWWVFVTGHVVMKMLGRSENRYVTACVKCFGYEKHVDEEVYDSEEHRQTAEAAKKAGKRNTIGDMYAVPRFKVRAGAKGGALARADVANDDVELKRNPAWRPDNEGEAHRLDQLEDVEINPLHQTIVAEGLTSNDARQPEPTGPRRVEDADLADIVPVLSSEAPVEQKQAYNNTYSAQGPQQTRHSFSNAAAPALAPALTATAPASSGFEDMSMKRRKKRGSDSDSD